MYQKCNNTCNRQDKPYLSVLRLCAFFTCFDLHIVCSEIAMPLPLENSPTMQRNIVHKARQGRVLGSLCIGQGRLLAGGEKFRHNFQITFVL